MADEVESLDQEEEVLTRNKSRMIKVTLGGEDREFRVLTIKESREWRSRFRAMAAAQAGIGAIDAGDDDQVQANAEPLLAALEESPNGFVDLFFAYAKDLPRDEIENVATDVEIADGMLEVMRVAFPFGKVIPANL